MESLVQKVFEKTFNEYGEPIEKEQITEQTEQQEQSVQIQPEQSVQIQPEQSVQTVPEQTEQTQPTAETTEPTSPAITVVT